MKLPIGQLIQITIDENREPLLAIVTDECGNGTYELTRVVDEKVIKSLIPYHELVRNFSSGHFKLILD
jgi:hypothetical protein